MNLLQKIIFPNIKFNIHEKMYVRLLGSPVFQIKDGGELYFALGGKANFDTYFSSFSVEPWKRNTTVENLSIGLKGSGNFIIKIWHQTIFSSPVLLYNDKIDFNNEDYTYIQIKQWTKLQEGMLFFQLICIDSNQAKLSSAAWFTSTLVKRSPKLGMVITHYNRKQYALPAISRIKKELLDDESYRGKIELIVVDNSQNITPDEAAGAIVIPNKNYGGSGGFMRGLLYLQDNGFSHCLFMDDDASCEVESIKRTYNMLAYAKDEQIAVGGSLLREIEPYRLSEKGAKFDGLCHPLKGGLDMRSPKDLLIADFAPDNSQIPDYGGWWFFGFSISNVKNYAFPFFVRGDDVMFDMRNNFKIVTMNGIAGWAEDFGLKEGPLPRYLDTRSHLVHCLTYLNKNFRQTYKIALKLFISSLFSYNYASARAVLKALHDVSIGPSFWKENMDTFSIRKEIGSYEPSEKMLPINRAHYQIVYGNPNEKRRRKIVRVLSLNGFLLPNFLLKDEVLFQQKSFRGHFREIFRYKKVLYEYEPTHVGYIAVHDKKRFFNLCYLFFKESFLFLSNFKKIKKSYQENFSEMTSREFWVKQLLENKGNK